MNDRKRISDDNLEEMLKNYCSRKPDRVFELRKDNKTMKRNTIFKVATAGVCAAAVLTVGLFSNHIPFSMGDDTASAIQQLENSLTINACAVEAGNMDVDFTTFAENGLGGVKTGTTTLYFLDDEEKTMLEGEQLNEYLSAGQAQYNGYDVLTKEDMGIETYVVAINISGNNIESYSIESQKGDLFFYDRSKEDVYFSIETAEAPDEDTTCLWSCEYDLYLDKERITKLENIPYDAVNKDNVLLEWSPSWIDFFNDLCELTGEGVTYENCDLRIAAANELLQTAEDYTKYFGDTLTLTVNYEDGTSVTREVVITLDDEGQYHLNY